MKTIFEVHLAYGELEEASAIVEEIRQGLTKTIGADVLYVKLLLVTKRYEECLEAIERLPFADTDEDGFEIGRAAVGLGKGAGLAGPRPSR